MTLAAGTFTVGPTNAVPITGTPQAGAAIVLRNLGPDTILLTFGTQESVLSANTGVLLPGDSLTLPASDYITAIAETTTATLCYFVGNNVSP